MRQRRFQISKCELLVGRIQDEIRADLGENALFVRGMNMNDHAWRGVSVAGFSLALWMATLPASAIVDANSNSNTSAPSDGAPWDNVGAIGGASGVYIGGGWVLTASHVGVGTITLGNTSFNPDGTSLRLTNSDGTSTDLVLFHLANVPALPSLPLATATPAAFSQIDLIGCGHIAGSGQTNFGLYSGFYWSAGGAKSWGNNKVNLGGTTVINIGYGNLTTFVCDFSSPGTIGPTAQTSDEAQVAGGDSGGGAFQKNGATWQLAGILDAEGNQQNQSANTAVYGDKTYMADLATYQGQVAAALTAQPVPALSISHSGTNALISWPATGVSYNLQAAATFNPSRWTTVSQSQFSTNGLTGLLVPDSSGFQFFRLQKP